MKTFLATLVAAAVLATAVVSVRMHLDVAQLRYRLWSLSEERVRAERAAQLARADLEAAKAPRRLLERWAELRGEAGSAVPPSVAARPAAPSPSGSDADEGDIADAVEDREPPRAAPPPPPPPAPLPAETADDAAAEGGR